MIIIATVNCKKCGVSKTEWLDSIPYCPKCGKPMIDESIVKTEVKSS